jgi:hypothetical protein
MSRTALIYLLSLVFDLFGSTRNELRLRKERPNA